MALSYQYNKQSKKDILRHAKALEKCQIGDVYALELNGKKRQDRLEMYAERNIKGWIDENGGIHKGDKGLIGFLVQDIYFDEPKDNKSKSDLNEAGVELKVSPLIKKPRAGLKVKERLVLGMINKEEKLPDVFRDSHIYEKCKLMMLVYYVDESNQNVTPFKFPFYKSAYVKIPEADMAMIEQDYRYIRDCVNKKKYDELHERNAYYLSPCPKNNRRAFSLKLSYMNRLFSEYINKDILLYNPEKKSKIVPFFGSIIRNPKDLKRESFETIVQGRFNRYKGKTVRQIRQSIMKSNDFKKWNQKNTVDKAEFARTTMAMLGVETDQAEEFVKAGIYVKTLRVNKNGTMNENISFSAFDFSDLLEEKWKESTVYEEMVNRKFLWSVFKENEKGEYVFHGAIFWSMPQDDEKIIKKGWEDIRDIIRAGIKFVKDVNDDGSPILTTRGKNRILNNFPDSRNTDKNRKEYRLCPSPKPYNRIISIRPHASLVYYDLKSIGYKDTGNPRCNGSCLPNGDVMTKQCFWFNNEYILEQIKEIL
ncbi:Sau3AI family type II restriction endonuclease [Fibrobacter sp.]|uniref:Sau3AI family type II restriction endonuclease n=1 Tax=Fibrobacter sp. TaxID=35828 RepID=UPI00388E9E47